VDDCLSQIDSDLSLQNVSLDLLQITKVVEACLIQPFSDYIRIVLKMKLTDVLQYYLVQLLRSPALFDICQSLDSSKSRGQAFH